MSDFGIVIEVWRCIEVEAIREAGKQRLWIAVSVCLQIQQSASYKF
jgi:hypothetical protein